MKSVVLGPVFDVPVMDRREREVLQAELQLLDQQLREFTLSMEKWGRLAARARREFDAPADLRERTIARYERKKKLVAATAKLRAILLAELFSQPEYQPGFHYSH